MVPQLELASPTDYGVPVISGGGFDFLTAKHDFAEEIAAGDRPVTVLHIGDLDPSGAHLYLAFKPRTSRRSCWRAWAARWSFIV